MTDSAVATFKASLRGGLIAPGDAGYDEARKVYNGMIDRRPRFIARCADVADVIAAVNFGREQQAARLDPRRRPQRRRPRRVRRRPGDRSVADAIRARRSEEEDGARRRWRAVGRRRSRDAPLRPRRAVRHHLDHRRRRSHAGRRHRPPHAAVRADDRQPARRGDGAGQRQVRHRHAPRRIPICSGRCAAAAATSAW